MNQVVQQKPFCDNTHQKEDFQTVQLDVVKVDESAETGGELVITATGVGVRTERPATSGD